MPLEEEPGRLHAVARTATVLRALALNRGGLTLSELSATVDLPLSSVHRLVTAMAAEGLVSAQPRGRIFLGPLIMEMSRTNGTPLGDEVADVMRDLSARLQATVDVAERDGDSLRFVAQCAAGSMPRLVSSIGVLFPLHCTGSGKAFLARMSQREATSILPRRLPRLTSRTITSRKALWKELEEIRACGIGCDREEHHMGIASMATVVTDSRGTDVAISIVMPAARVYDSEEALAAVLRKAASFVERRVALARQRSTSI